MAAKDLGLKYVGPIDGHDREAVEHALRAARGYPGPVIVHCLTEKGRGYDRAEQDEMGKRAGPAARLFVTPHGVCFHLEHHLLMTVPYFRLGALHRLLAERGVLEETPVAPVYVAVLRRATASR